LQQGIVWMETPLGLLCLEQAGEGLCRAEFCAEAEGPPRPTPLLGEAQRQLEEYFARRRRVFELPLAGQGTAFRRQVWQALEQIPYGQVCSYGQLAARLGRPGAARAVGGACHCNPLAILVPCHRVVGADGGLTGYAGGLERKRWLLELEGVRL